MAELGLALGAVSFAFDAFKAIEGGCALFMDAAAMDEDMESLRLQLLIEYSRIVDWAVAVGIVDQNRERYDVQVKHNKAILYAVLSEIRVEVQAITKIRIRYVPKEREHKMDSEKACPSDKSTGDSSPSARLLPTKQTDVLKKSRPSEQDMLCFADVLASVEVAPTAAKHRRGTNTIIKFFESSKRIVAEPRRISWAHHGKESFEEHLSRVQELTAYLHQAVETATTQKLLENTNTTCLAVVELTKGQQEVHLALIETQHRLHDFQATMTQRVEVLSRASGQGRSDIAGSRIDYSQLLQFKMLRKKTLLTKNSGSLPDTEKDMKDMKMLNSSEQEHPRTTHACQSEIRSIGVLTGEAVVIEWKPYESLAESDEGAIEAENDFVEGAGAGARHETSHAEGRHTTSSENKGENMDEVAMQPPTRTLRRIQQLSAMLIDQSRPEEFRIPEFVGYVHDSEHHRLGLVYKRSESSKTVPSMLEALSGPGPTLNAKLRAAIELSSSLLYLHAIGWLHKNLRSSNIIFPDGRSPESKDLDNLKIVGFEFARQDDQGVTSTNVDDDSPDAYYRHPSARDGDQYRKTFDIYSLGIILIELAVWKPIGDIVQEAIATTQQHASGPQTQQSTPDSACEQKASETKTKKGQYDVLPSQRVILDCVTERMGTMYCAAVEACINARLAFEVGDEDEESDAVVGTWIQLAYTKQVVDVLRRISV